MRRLCVAMCLVEITAPSGGLARLPALHLMVDPARTHPGPGGAEGRAERGSQVLEEVEVPGAFGAAAPGNDDLRPRQLDLPRPGRLHRLHARAARADVGG